jgi:hypothetical protein
MKKIAILLFSLFTFSVNAQVIDYNNFDNKLLERLVFEELNRYRDSLGVIDLLWSEVMYKKISCKQTSILAKGSSLYHPGLDSLFTDEFRTSVSKESQKLTGIKSKYNCEPSSVTTLSENGFSTDLEKVTYQQMAKIAIMCWDKSPLHKCNQKWNYYLGGGKGLVSVSARINNSKSKIFIFCNFTEVRKEKTN